MSPTHGDSAEMMLRRRRSEPDDEESKKDQTASSTRASARNQGAEMALVAVDRERVGKPSPNGPVGEDMKTPLPIEDFPAEPVGSPKALGPRNLQPLFNEAQLKKAEELRLSAPLLQGPSPTAVSQSTGGWDGGLAAGKVGMGKEADMSEGPSRKGPEVLMMSPMGYPLAPQHGYGYVPHHTQQGMFDEMMWQFRQEMGQMSKSLTQLQEENLRLRIQLMEERETRYTTPPDVTPAEGLRDSARRQKVSGKKPKSKGVEAKQEDFEASKPKEAAGRGEQEAETPKAEEEVIGRKLEEVSKEDGPAGQQESSEESQSIQEEESEDSVNVKDHKGRSKKEDTTVDVMLKLMQGMQSLQQQLLDRETIRGRRLTEDDEEEHVRSSVELHKLPEWTAENAPVDLQDWLLLIHAQMSDLTTSSSEWWDLVVETAKDWYHKHQAMKPIDKLKHEVRAPPQLQQKKWRRLEKRGSSLLLQALPSSQRDDIVAGKDLSVLAILAKLLNNYQPGGSHEKAAVLAALELPAEAVGIGEGILGLRRWLRWKKRAEDMGLQLPDPSVLLRGLDRLVSKILAGNPTLQFRINLTRTTLMVDSVPTMSSIDQLAECLLAEMDQVSYAKKKEKAAIAGVPKARKMEEAGKRSEVPQAKKGDEGKKEMPKCKYFLTENGCRRGKACRWDHNQKDDQRRCWNCGSTKHFSNKCPVSEGQGEVKVAKAEKDGEARKKKNDEEDNQSDRAVAGADDMKSLLEEAGKMLKVIPGASQESSSVEETGDAKIRRLQRQLDELRASSVRVLRLARVQAAVEDLGLLDSGATHPLRPPKKDEDLSKCQKVRINLAGGKQTMMMLSEGGAIIGSEDVEPIVPLGALVENLGCSLQWTEGHMVLYHPFKGQISTQLKEGCPMINKSDALELIEELEKKAPELRSVEGSAAEAYMHWMKRLVEEHPALQGVPKRITERLVISPKEGHITGNRSRRKLWKKEGGVTLYLYSGPNEGYTMAKAIQLLGGEKRKVIAVDIKNGAKWDMMEDDLYAELMDMVIKGQVESLVMSPNCRTRSKLRHCEVEGVDLPGPVREWNGGEWGKKGIGEREEKKCHEDDVMLFRGLMLYMVAQEIRKASRHTKDIDLVFEHPSTPANMPQVVSFWSTPQWQALKQAYGLWEIHLDQGKLGGGGVKPTTLGGNLRMQVPSVVVPAPQPRCTHGKTKEQIVQESQSLSRWVPLLTDMVACALLESQGITPKLRSWRTHVQRCHQPFRKDCKVCQEAAARARPHRRQKLPPRAGVLSVDIAGPLTKAPDLGKDHARFVLVAAFTWPTGLKGDDLEELPEEDDEDDFPGWEENEEKPKEEIGSQKPGAKKRGRPRKKDPEEEFEELLRREQEEQKQKRQKEKEAAEPPGTEEPLKEAAEPPGVEEPLKEAADPQKKDDDEKEGDYMTRVAPDVEYEPTEPGEDPFPQVPAPDVPEEQQAQIQVHRLAFPLPDKRGITILNALIDAYLTLRSEGMFVNQLHSDLGGEFTGAYIEKWCKERCILTTTTPGVSPQTNGRAERAVQAMKTETKKILRGAQVGIEWWPIAVRYLNEVWKRNRTEAIGAIPPFMSKVLIRRRYWRTKDMEPNNEEVHYLAPSWRNYGHWVLRSDNTQTLTRAVITNTVEPVTEDTWIALEDNLTPLDLRRRIRGKAMIRKVQEEKDEESRQDRLKREKVIQEEAEHAFYDDEEVVEAVLRGVKAMQEMDQEDEGEVLQTKIVGTAEVVKKKDLWHQAISNEITSLFSEKKALKLLTKEESDKYLKERGAIPLPSKTVFTVKPDPAERRGKRKCRIVACGNYETVGGDENCFAAGADAAALRLALALATVRKWCGINVDIRTAFLNAPWKHEKGGEDWFFEEEGEEAPLPMLLRPPPILVKLGYFPPYQLWEVLRALYGFRRSPKLWKDYRDEEMEKMRVGKMRLHQLESEPSTWAIRQEETGDLQGLMLTYVDDILVLASEETAEAWISCIQSKWETSVPEKVGCQQTTRFLGMELSRDQNGVWCATQHSYTLDLLQKNMGMDREKWGLKKIPMSKEDGSLDSDGEEDAEKTVEKVREAQRIVGELTWLVTRCRPDIMYVMSRISRWTTRRPSKVIAAAPQIWKYLANSIQEGIRFGGNEDGCLDLLVYTDAAYGNEGHGCSVVMWLGAPILWRSSRQQLQTASTAESELLEILEGGVLAEAVRVVVEEILEKAVRCWQYSDSASAIAIVGGDSASWRTRHLRKRARYMRWRVLSGDVILRHTPGNGMIADLGTKALAALKLEELKKAMGMTDRKIKTEKEKEDLGVVRGPTEEKEENGVVREPAIETKEAKGGIKSPKDMVRMAMIMAMLSRARAEDEDGDAGEESSIFFDMMMVYTIVVVLVTLAIQSGWQRRLLRAETAVGSDRSRGELAQRSARTSGLMTDGPTSVPGETVLGFGGGDQSRDELPRGSSQLLGSARTSGLTSQTGGPTSLPGETVLGFGRGDQSRDELPRRSGQPSGSARTSGLASQTDCPTSPPGETVLGFGGGDQSRDELPRRSGPPLKEEKEETPKAVKRAKSMGQSSASKQDGQKNTYGQPASKLEAPLPEDQTASAGIQEPAIPKAAAEKKEVAPPPKVLQSKSKGKKGDEKKPNETTSTGMTQIRTNHAAAEPKVAASSSTSTGAQIPADPSSSADPSIDLYFTGLGKKYHFRKDCYGLRNSQMVRHTDICEQCVPQLRGWHPRGRDMYGAGLNGPQHTDVTHCEKMHGYSIAYQPCNWCARPNESEK